MVRNRACHAAIGLRDSIQAYTPEFEAVVEYIGIDKETIAVALVANLRDVAIVPLSSFVSKNSSYAEINVGKGRESRVSCCSHSGFSPQYKGLRRRFDLIDECKR